MTESTKAMIGTFLRVFVGAALATFLAQGADIFALDQDGLKAIVSSAVAAVAVLGFNILNPRDTRYGVGAETTES